MNPATSFLSPQQRADLIARRKRERNARYAERILVVLWHDGGISYQEIAHRLFLDPKTPAEWVRSFRRGGAGALPPDNYKPYEGKLDPQQRQQLDAHVGQHIFMDVSPIIL